MALVNCFTAAGKSPAANIWLPSRKRASAESPLRRIRSTRCCPSSTRLSRISAGLSEASEPREQNTQVRLNGHLSRMRGEKISIALHGSREISRLLQLDRVLQRSLRRGCLAIEQINQNTPGHQQSKHREH